MLDVAQEHAADFDDHDSDDDAPHDPNTDGDQNNSSTTRRERKEINAQSFIQQVKVKKSHMYRMRSAYPVLGMG